MPDRPEHFDAVVVGSGFGGSVSAFRMAEAGLDVLLLERGRAWPPGSFPRSPAEIKANFWDPSDGLYGLFNVWSFRKIEALVSSGLGGGSLIYANVLLRKDERWFVDEGPDGSARPWPMQRADLETHYDAVEEVLQPVPYPYDDTAKTNAMTDAARRAGFEARRPPIAVTFSPTPGAPPSPAEPVESTNLHGRGRQTCHLCGECDVGCNSGAKNTLDFNYLTMAQQAGAEIRTGSEVVALAPDPNGRGYAIDYVEHDVTDPTPVATRTLPRRRITATRLVLAAGTLGSTYLLLRNRSAFPGLSPALGTRFCGNGDLLGFVTGASQTLDPSRGPVITTAIRRDDTVEGGDGPGLYLEDGGYPGFLDWILVGQPFPSRVFRVLKSAARVAWHRMTGDPRSDLSGELSALMPRQSTRTALPLLGMGRDTPDGVMSLRRGYLDIDWDMATSKAFFDRVEATMRRVSSALGAEYTRNPLGALKRVITVHPLGGCPMATNPREGVVDPYGEVFGYPGLFVADGAVMPGPVGPNPSLTIAALADRFADRMAKEPTDV